LIALPRLVTYSPPDVDPRQLRDLKIKLAGVMLAASPEKNHDAEGETFLWYRRGKFHRKTVRPQCKFA
jgi:hypothetical protein